MIQLNYQLLLIGNSNPFERAVEQAFKEKIDELGIDNSKVSILWTNDFAQYKSNAPAVCVYFGGESQTADQSIVDVLIEHACVIIPVVEDITQFSKLVPSSLRPINGFELNQANESNKLPALISRLLETLGLLRKARKLFISYRRTESRSVALQLYDYLDSCGFAVFLDTHSIDAGTRFQDELWHSMADTDVLLLLNTNNFVGNKWTDQELAKAANMSVGIIQLVWPDCKNVSFINQTAFATPAYLKDSDFVDGNLSAPNAKLETATLKNIERDVESLRARALAARRDNLVREFMKAAHNFGCNAVLESDKIILLTDSNGNKTAVVPTVGVPDVYTSYQRTNILKAILSSTPGMVIILFDHRNILEDYLVFIGWLSPLPVQFKKITDMDNWLQVFCK
jgi:hypothetical protein